MDINSLMKQAKEMQQKLQQNKDELAKKIFEGKSGGGLVTMQMTGDKMLRKVDIDKSLLQESEKEILEDLIIACYNDVKKKLDDAGENDLTSSLGGMKLPF